MRWLKEETPVMEDAVQEVEEPAKEVAPLEAALHQACPRGHQNSGPARNLRVTSSPSAQGTRARMGTCSARPRRRWQHTSAPSMETRQLRNGLVRSILCPRSHSAQMQLRSGTPKEFELPRKDSIAN